MKLISKTHIKDGKTLVVVCDKELIGRVLEDGACVLDLSDDFYKGDLMTEEEVGDVIRNADMVNLIGDKSVKIGIAEDIIDEKHIKIIEGVPFAMGVIIVD